MLNLFLLAGQAYGSHSAVHWYDDPGGMLTMPPTTTTTAAPRAATDTDFEVISCNRLVDNEPEMTLLISQDYYEENLRDMVDGFTFSNNGYEKVIPEDELLVDFDDECKYYC